MALGVDGTAVGCWTHPEHRTGTTVILPPEGSLGAAAVRGGAPGTREVAALSADGSVTACHAVVLSGGSAFGLAAADGAMAWCEEHGIGHDKQVARVPIVGAAIVFDLREAGAPRPGADAGRAACAVATVEDPPQGPHGVGAGCTVGKTGGLEWASAGGQGWSVQAAGGVTVGALMAVNALGDVVDERGEVLAGSRASPSAPRYPAAAAPGAGEHTVIGCVVTDAVLDKPAAARVADLAHTGVARAVDPAHTSFDGDALFVLAAQRRPARVDLVADLAARAVADAIRSAVRHSVGLPGAPADPRSRG